MNANQGNCGRQVAAPRPLDKDLDSLTPCLQAAYAAYKLLQQVLACEALAAVVSLRLQEGRPAGPAAAAAAEPAPGKPWAALQALV